MIKYIIRRLIGLIPIVIGVAVLSFMLMQLAPGGPESAIQGAQRRLTFEQIDAWLARWCLERENDFVAVLRQFGGWVGVLNCQREGLDQFFSNQGGLNVLPGFLGGGDNGLLHGDLGRSTQTGRPVLDMIRERVPGTLFLTITALVLWVTIAVLAGVYAAVRRYSFFDQGLTFFAYVFYS
ncbi:MAG TPA: ABC transporter permease, partial [Actinomycetota bacterium]|nr:ABC transporter permease [Actinomycetota bacterium]